MKDTTLMKVPSQKGQDSEPVLLKTRGEIISVHTEPSLPTQ